MSGQKLRKWLGRLLLLGVFLGGELPAQADSTNPGFDFLSFQDFFQTPIGPKGLVLTEKVQALQDHGVRLSGYRVRTEMPTVGWFLLVPLPNQISPEEDGDANDLPANTVLVWLDPAHKRDVVPNDGAPLTVEGRFHWGAVVAPDGQTYWFSLQLP